MNNGDYVNDANQVSIFDHAPVQILKMPPTRGQPLASQKSGLSNNPSSSTLGGAAAPAAPPDSKEYLFGAARGGGAWSKETSSHELGRLEICTVRQLQRAMQQKIQQSTRNPMGVWTAFHKLDRRGVQHLNFDDLVAAVAGFNLSASDELVDQLMRALDSDHDGLLSLPEFVAGLKGDGYGVQTLSNPQYGISSRRYFRTIKFHHPLHNMAHHSQFHTFEENSS
jgi:hypothetical protein